MLLYIWVWKDRSYVLFCELELCLRCTVIRTGSSKRVWGISWDNCIIAGAFLIQYDLMVLSQRLNVCVYANTMSLKKTHTILCVDVGVCVCVCISRKFGRPPSVKYKCALIWPVHWPERALTWGGHWPERWPALVWPHPQHRILPTRWICRLPSSPYHIRTDSVLYSSDSLKSIRELTTRDDLRSRYGRKMKLQVSQEISRLPTQHSNLTHLWNASLFFSLSYVLLQSCMSSPFFTITEELIQHKGFVLDKVISVMLWIYLIMFA